MNEEAWKEKRRAFEAAPEPPEEEEEYGEDTVIYIICLNDSMLFATDDESYAERRLIEEKEKYKRLHVMKELPDNLYFHIHDVPGKIRREK